MNEALRSGSRTSDDAGAPAVELVAAFLAIAMHLALVLLTPRGALRLAAPLGAAPEPVHVFDLAPIEEPPPAPVPVPVETQPAPAAESTRAPHLRQAEPRALAPSPRAEALSAPSNSDAPLDLSSMVVGGLGGMDFGGGVGGGGVGTSGAPTRTATQAPDALSAVRARVARDPADLRSDVRPPPDLDRLLESFYPASARAQGIAGDARVRLRLDESGAVLAVTIVSESPPGASFGAACRRMLLEGPSWSPAIDPNGVAIARAGRDFRCRFELRGGL